MISNHKKGRVSSDDKIFFVYILLKTYKKGKFIYEDLEFEYEPFYVGKGYAFGGYNRLVNSLFYGNKFKNHVINKHKTLNLNVTLLMYKVEMTEQESLDLEMSIIKKIGKRIENIGPLTNITDGGEGRTGPQYNKRIPVLQYDRNGNFIREYESQDTAIHCTNISNISRSCDTESSAGGYIWRKKKDKIEYKIDTSFLKNKIHQGNLKRRVALIDDSGNILQEFDSIKEAMEKTGCNKSKIVPVCKGILKHTKGKKFIYL